VKIRSDLEKSKPLCIVLNGPQSFAGRKVGALVPDGVDATLIGALRAALEAEGAALEIIAPTVGGVQTSDGASLKADHKFGGGPSVLFDAVAILNAADATAALLPNAAVGDFIRDAFGHLKFIGYTEAAMPLFQKAGIADALDEACVRLDSAKSTDDFITACRKLRFWKREETVSFKIAGPMSLGFLALCGAGIFACGPAFQPVLPPGKAAAATIGRPTTRNQRD